MSGKFWLGLGIAVFSLVLLLGLVPQSYIPEQFVPFVAATGKFEGSPIRVKAPSGGKPEAGATIRIKMREGICRGSVQRGSEQTGLFSMSEGSCRARIPIGSELVLDPQGKAGTYYVAIGPEWHPLAPKGRRFVLLPMAISIAAVTVFASRFRRQVDTLGTKRVLFLFGLTVISGLVLYPAIHEGGHMIFGIMFGAVPDWGGVVWTCLSGEEPHASFVKVPERATALMSAGGQILPTLVALLLLLIWRFAHGKVSWPVSAALVSLPVLFLLSTLGCIFELYQNTHVDALSVGLGLTGVLRVILSLSPLFVAAAAYAWLWNAYRKTRLATGQTGQR